MKNALQLEIVNLLKKANKHYARCQMTQSLQILKESHKTYTLNKNYNPLINTNYQAALHSLMGKALAELGDYENAQKSYGKCLEIDPCDFLTLLRRAQLYVKANLLEEAIEDIETAHLYGPEPGLLCEVVASVRQRIFQITDPEQKVRLNKNLGKIFAGAQQNEELEEEVETLDFCHLRNIDVLSSMGESRGKCDLPVQKDFVREYEPSDKLKVYGNNCSSQKHSSFRVNQVLEKSQHMQPKHSICSETRQKRSSRIKFIETPTAQIFKNVENKPRNSCLKATKSSDSTKLILQRQTLGRSSFLNIKNVDGVYLRSSSKQKVVKNFNSRAQVSDSESDQENNEHSIYRRQLRQSKIQNLLNTLTSQLGRASVKKGSIMKKSSVLSKENQSTCSANSKKSVCFRERPQNLHLS